MFELLPIFAISFFGIFLNVWFFMMTFENLSASILPKSKQARRLPKVSILIPAHNEAANIGKTLRSVFRLDYPKEKLEVIVVDNASTDDTAEIARGFPRARVLKISQKGKPVALERGFELSSGEVVGILDADTLVSRNVLRKMVGHFGDPKIGAVTNLITVDSKRNLLSRFQQLEYMASALSKKLLSILDALYIAPGTLSLIRREAVKKVGFSGDTLTEDMDLALSLIKSDYKIFHCLDARVKTIIPKTMKSWAAQRTRWYRGYIQNMQKHRDLIFNKKHLVLGWFVIPISGLLAIAVGIYTTFYFLGDFAYKVLLKLQSLPHISLADQLAVLLQSFPSITDFVYNPYALMLFTIVFFTSASAIVLSARVVKGVTKRDMLFIPLYMLVYYGIIMVYWLISVFQEFFRRGRTW